MVWSNDVCVEMDTTLLEPDLGLQCRICCLYTFSAYLDIYFTPIVYPQW